MIVDHDQGGFAVQEGLGKSMVAKDDADEQSITGTSYPHISNASLRP